MNKIAIKDNKSAASVTTKKKQILDDVRAKYAYEILKKLADASEMFEEVLEPYIDKLKKCQKLSMDEDAKLHCMGILKGIYKFEKEATTEFQDWAVDDPHDNFRQIFEEWKKGNKYPKNLEDMDEFIERNCPEWHKDIMKK